MSEAADVRKMKNDLITRARAQAAFVAKDTRDLLLELVAAVEAKSKREEPMKDDREQISEAFARQPDQEPTSEHDAYDPT